MDRRFSIALILVVIASIVIGVVYTTRQQTQKSDRLTIVASFYPLAYMAE